EVLPGRTIEIGPFEIEFISVTHSTLDCVALAIRTPLGVIIHTGDFKIDQTPVDGASFDLHALAKYGSEGVLALFSDSTNVERPGFTPSERAVVPRIEELSRSAPRRVILSCFASSIHRIQQVIDIAVRVNRKVAFVGRSMIDNVEIAHSLGLLQIPDGMVVRPQDIRGFDPRRLVILASGSQAEPMSSLSRIAVDKYRHLFRHAALAHQLGAVSEEIFLLENGQAIEFTEEGAQRRDPVTAGRVLVDSGSLEEIEEVVIRDRKHLSEDGVVVPIIAIDK